MNYLYSILTGIITGLIVALSFWFIQLRGEKNRVRHEASRDFSLFLGKLSDSISQPNTINISSAVNLLPSVASVINQTIASSPIDYWHSHIADKNNRVVISEIMRFRNQYKTSKIAAQHLDIALQQKIRLYNASKGIIAVNDRADHSFFLGKFNGMSTKEIMPWIDLPGQASGRLEASYEALKNDGDIAIRVNEYKREKEELETAIENLVNHFLL